MVEGYLIQHYLIEFVSDLTGWWFSSGTPISSINKTDRHDITAILLIEVLNIITTNPNPFFSSISNLITFLFVIYNI